MVIGTHELVGREEELGSLVAALDSLPAVAVVAGDAGIGKTALWLAAVEEARARGFRILSCRPSEAEARYSFSGLTDLLGTTVPEGLPAPQQKALETALALTAAERPVDEGVLAFAFLGAVRTLAAEGSVVLAVDDVQWLDQPSLALLRYAISRFEAERIAVFLTARGEVPLWLARVDGTLELELRPLSVGAVHELLRTRLDAALPRPMLLRIWDASGGNPFFALELARALQRRGGRIEPGAELPVPETLEELVLERLRALTPEADDVCRVIAAASEPTVSLVEQIADGPAGLEQALEARVLELEGDRLRFVHPLLGSAIAARSVGERKRALHERLAVHASDPEERARHLALSASGPSAPVAEALDGAARQARARGSAAAAADLVEQALLLTPTDDDEPRRRRRLEAADLHFEAGDVSRSLAVLEHAAAVEPHGHRRAAVLVRLGRVRAETHGAEAAVAIWREALAEATGNDELEARILFELGRCLRFTEGAEAGLEHLERAVEAAERVGNDELACRVLGAHALIHLNSGRGVDQGMERALALEAKLGERSLPATPFLVHQLVWTGDVERAREHIERWACWARSRDHPDVGDAAWYLALLEWRHGSWDAAAGAASAAVTFAEQFGREPETIASWHMAVIAAHRGDLARAQALAERGLRASALPRIAEAGFGWVLAIIELSRDDARGALEHLERAEDAHEALGIFEPALRWHVPDLFDALLAAGETGRVEELLAPFARRALELDRPWAVAIAARTEALLMAQRGDTDGASAAFREALAAHEHVPAPFQRARTLLALGATQRRAKQRRAARETLEEALMIFTELPAPLWVEKARGELARIGGRTPSRGELTEAERRIAGLVAEGLTNREVAAALFLAEHSVETALSRVYRKLGVRSRTELAGRLAREPAEPPVSKS